MHIFCFWFLQSVSALTFGKINVKFVIKILVLFFNRKLGYATDFESIKLTMIVVIKQDHLYKIFEYFPCRVKEC